MIVHGVSVNQQTQCAHYHSERDVVAVQFKCCDTFYACIDCHNELAGHTPLVWGKDARKTPAVLCGKCQNTMSISADLDCRGFSPLRGTAFNPGGSRHGAPHF